MPDDPALRIFPDRYLPNAVAATITYDKWRRQQPAEYAKWVAFRDAVLRGEQVSVPVLSTRKGKELVAAAEQHMSISRFVGTIVPPLPTPSPPSQGIPPLPASWDSPIVITSGGTYEGAWESTTSTPAVTVQTSEPVVIRGYVRKLGGSGAIIDAIPGGQVQLTIERLYAYGPADWPGSPRFMWSNNHKSITVRNCTIINTGGMEIEGGAASSTVLITKNRHRNIVGNATGGVVTVLGNFVQFRTTVNSAITVSWNEIINEYNKSMPEDLISMYHSSNAQIFDNYFQHQSALNNTGGSSQSGITLDASTPGVGCHNITVSRNQVVDGYGIFAALGGGPGSNILLENNRLIGDQFLPSGVLKGNGANSPLAIIGSATNCHAHGNLVGYIDVTQSYCDAAALAAGLSGAAEGGATEAANNTLVAQGDVNATAEAAEWTFWQQKLADNSIFIGA